MQSTISKRLKLRALCLLALITVVSSSALSNSARADEAENTKESPSATSLPEEAATTTQDVFITATSLIDDPFEIPYMVSALPAVGENSMRPLRSIGEAFAELPQVMTQRTSYGSSSPYVRGFTGFRTLVLMDGFRLNNAIYRDGPNQYTTFVDAQMISRAELVTGPSSVLHGSDAVGGTIQFFTPDYLMQNKEGWSGRVFQRYSSAEESSVTRVESQYFGKRYAFHVGGSWRDYGDFSGGRHLGEFANTGYEEWSGDAKFQYALSDQVNLTLAYQKHHQERVPRSHSTVFGVSYRGTSVGSDLQRDTTGSRELAYAKFQWRGDEDQEATLSFSRSVFMEREDRTRSTLRKRIQGITDVALGVQAQYKQMNSLGTITLGADYSREGVDSHFREFNGDGSLRALRVRGPVADQSTYHLMGAYLEQQWVINPTFEIHAGTRYTIAVVDADDVDPDPTDGNVIASINESFSASVSSLRAIVHANDNLNFFAGASQAFRAPNLSDLTRFDVSRSGEAEVPATDLDPEHFLTAEIGGKYEDERFSAQAAYFYTWIDDMIVRFPTGATDADGDAIVSKHNSGDGFVHGVELAGSYNIKKGLKLVGSFAWIEGKADILIAPGVEKEEPLSRLMPATGIIGIHYQPEEMPFQIELDLRMAREQGRLSARDMGDTQRFPTDGTPGYGVWGLRVRYEVKKGCQIFAGVENITDKDYRIHGSGSNEPGTNFVAGLDWRF